MSSLLLLSLLLLLLQSLQRKNATATFRFELVSICLSCLWPGLLYLRFHWLPSFVFGIHLVCLFFLLLLLLRPFGYMYKLNWGHTCYSYCLSLSLGGLSLARKMELKWGNLTNVKMGKCKLGIFKSEKIRMCFLRIIMGNYFISKIKLVSFLFRFVCYVFFLFLNCYVFTSFLAIYTFSIFVSEESRSPHR